ncbi:MAG: cytochrome ubiquinol oxidase subunit I, partial [Candidatus Rokubacteria bacterium]|nr:cytochrome ubiquinol oxidase subunit I [Candidatus Rokubacteria bacterium]
MDRTLEMLRRSAKNRAGWLGLAGSVALCGTLLWARSAFAADPPAPEEYRTLFDPDTWLGQVLSPRILVWIVAQLHLMFAAFVLAVPMFACLIELIGWLTKDQESARRYDKLAHEFTRLLATAFSITAIFGALLTFLLIGLYPKLMGFLVNVFGPSMYLYALIFFLESFSLYLYYYGWDRISKGKHLLLGLSLNTWGIVLLFITNAWVSFSMSPRGLDAHGAVVNRWAAFHNFLWNPLNIHRLIANLCLAGSVVGAYAAFKFL